MSQTKGKTLRDDIGKAIDRELDDEFRVPRGVDDKTAKAAADAKENIRKAIFARLDHLHAIIQRAEGGPSRVELHGRADDEGDWTGAIDVSYRHDDTSTAGTGEL